MKRGRSSSHGLSVDYLVLHSREIQKRAIEWFDQNKRDDIPWRGADPYGIWVSEVMSQQTTLCAVIPFWKRWMELFPTVEALADAESNTSSSPVLTAWAGLGYYRRAILLQKGAKKIVEEARKRSVAPRVPRDYHALLDIPGIGPYTAAAISTICYEHPLPKMIAIDGNVTRVFARLSAWRDFDPKCPKSNRMVAKINAKEGSPLLDGCDRPGDLNQGLMEIGSRICRGNGRPLCESCPFSRPYKKGFLCLSYCLLQNGDIPAIEGLIPLRPTKVMTSVTYHCLVPLQVHSGQEDLNKYTFWLIQETGNRLKGMLGFPTTETPGPIDKRIKKAGMFKYIITTNNITVHVYLLTVNNEHKKLPTDLATLVGKWTPSKNNEIVPLTIPSLKQHPISSITFRTIERILIHLKDRNLVEEVRSTIRPT